MDGELERLSGIADDELPWFIPARWHRPSQALGDLGGALQRALEELDLAHRVHPNARVAVAVGSRGITKLVEIVKRTVQHLQALGAEVFIVPAMGSHGGATAEGQRAVLARLGITEALCPIRATMDVVQLGTTPSGIPAFADRYAAEADHILLINRIKPHTAFSGEIGSGLLKMLAIGLGKQRGAQAAHRWAFQLSLERVIREVAQLMLAKLPVLGGLAIVEDFHHQPALIAGLRPEEFFVKEPELLEQARALMPRLPFDELDLLIVDEAGKEVSGTGMDTHVIGRFQVLNEPEPERPRIKRIYLRDLTLSSDGNGLGIGLADFIHERVLKRLDLQKTYINALTGTGPEKARVPVHLPSDRAAIKWALATIGPVPPAEARVLWIKNTLELERFMLSTALGAEAPEELELGQPQPLPFDSQGNLPRLEELLR